MLSKLRRLIQLTRQLFIGCSQGLELYAQARDLLLVNVALLLSLVALLNEVKQSILLFSERLNLLAQTQNFFRGFIEVLLRLVLSHEQRVNVSDLGRFARVAHLGGLQRRLVEPDGTRALILRRAQTTARRDSVQLLLLHFNLALQLLVKLDLLTQRIKLARLLVAAVGFGGTFS